MDKSQYREERNIKAICYLPLLLMAGPVFWRVIKFLELGRTDGLLMIGLAYMVLVILPVRLALKPPHWAHYILPVVLLLVLIWSIYYYITCTGKFCELGGLIFGPPSMGAMVIYLAMYLITRARQKLSLVHTILLLVATPFLVAGLISGLLGFLSLFP